MPGQWPTPPEHPRPAVIVESIYDTGERPPVMDLAMLETLNEEYRDRRMWGPPPTYDQPTRELRAQRRLTNIHRRIDLIGKKVLELGCAGGLEVWYLSHHFDSEAWGVDVKERRSWSILADDRTHYVCADIATQRLFEADSFDRVISNSVLEHVVHPYSILTELYRILRPGGLGWINANLYRGPRASHLRRELFFPFPHLLFSDDVILEFRQRHRGVSEGARWVNRLTWAQYEDYFREIGFTIRSLRFNETPLDEAFYTRFSNILGRYPRWDLTKDFFTVIVEKRGRRSARCSDVSQHSTCATESRLSSPRRSRQTR